ncbi:MAG: TonB-dependent receptor [Pseudomonadales bacterium]|nr:TonB-dependent receptor [Pseudomonadales bacterium]
MSLQDMKKPALAAYAQRPGIGDTQRGTAFRPVAWACLALALLTPLAHAQVALEVTVIDGSRAEPVAGANVEATNLDTGERVQGTTTADGRVRFGGLSTSGRWQIRTGANASYQQAQSSPLSLRSNHTQSVRLVLAPAGAEAQEILVTGSRSYTRINTLNAEVSSTLTAREIATLPVEARSLERALIRLPNVTQATGFFNEAPSIAINGANSLFTNYMIDGLDNNENFLGGQKFPVPIGMVQDVTVLASNYSSEFGRTANGVVNVTTKSGSNEFTSDVFFVTRPGDFLSKSGDFSRSDLSGNPVSENFKRYQGGFAVGGPIVKDETFFFLNMEYTRDETDNILSSPALGVAETVPGTNETWLGTARFDHRWNEQWSSMLRANHGRATIERQGGGLDGGLTFPSAGSEQDRYSTNVAFTTTFQDEQFGYSGSLQYSRFVWNFGQPLGGDGPQVTVRDPSGQTIAVVGHPGFVFNEVEDTFQTQHKLSFETDRHRLKLGVDVIRSDFKLEGGGNVDGNSLIQLDQAQLTALSATGIGGALTVADLPRDAQLLDFALEIQPNSFGTSQENYGVFVEDQFAMTPDLTLTLGLRWDYDSLSKGGDTSGDWDNIAPRASANWSFTDNMALRAGLGLFYEKIPYTVISDAIQFSSTAEGFKNQLQTLVDQGVLPAATDIERITSSGNLSVNPLAQCTGFLECPEPAAVASLREQQTSNELRILNPNGYDNPYALQATLGYQWQIADDVSFYVDGIYSSGHDLIRLIDLNAPAPFVFNQPLFDQIGAAGVAALSPEQREAQGLVRSAAAANASRPALDNGAIPAGGARSIVVSDTGGRSRYRALNFTLTKSRSDDWYGLRLSYTLSRLTNNTDDLNFRANDANDFQPDWGPSLNDRGHVISTVADFYPLPGLTLTVAGLIQSGQPITFVPDAAVFGTTDINGDGLSFADQFTGNPDRFPGSRRNSGRLPWATTIDLGMQYEFDSAVGTALLRADFFNVFNANNESGFPVNFTASNQRQLGGDAPFQQRSAAPPRTFQLSLQYLL